MRVIPRTTPLDPTVTNFPIQVCLAFGKDLKKAAKNVLDRIPETLKRGAWDDNYHGKPIDNLRFNMSIFGGLCQKAHFNNDLVVGQKPEFKKLEELESKINETIRELDYRVTTLQQNQGIPYIPGQGNRWGYTAQTVEAAVDKVFSKYAKNTFNASQNVSQKASNTFIYNNIEFLHDHRALTFATGAILAYYAIRPESGLQEWLTRYATVETIKKGTQAAKTASQAWAAYGAQILKTMQNISFVPLEAKALIGGSTIPATIWVAKRSLDCLPSFEGIKNGVKKYKKGILLSAFTASSLVGIALLIKVARR